jgi:hypothetical protein
MESSKSSGALAVTQASIAFAGAVAVSYFASLRRRTVVERTRDSIGEREEGELDSDVKAVLNYWFAGSLSENYKLKWFPSSSSSIQRRADDAIRTQFSEVFETATSKGLKRWGSSTKALVAEIIVLDQFSRCAMLPTTF